jgi:hypothetical protein
MCRTAFFRMSVLFATPRRNSSFTSIDIPQLWKRNSVGKRLSPDRGRRTACRAWTSLAMDEG